MSIEKSNLPTPEEQAELEKTRAISDAELLREGAEYKIDEETGEKQLIASDKNIEDIKTQKSHDEQIELEEKQKEETKRIEEIRMGVWEDIAKKWYNAPIKDIVEYYPELEKIKVTSLETHPEISLVRSKEVPEIATIILSKTSMSHPEIDGGLGIDVPDSRVEEGFVKIMFSFAGAYDRPESYFSARKRPATEDYEKFSERIKEEFKDSLQKICTENNVEYLIVRDVIPWLNRYGDLDGVEIIQIDGTGMSNDTMSEIEKIERVKGESIVHNIVHSGGVNSNFKEAGQPLIIRA